jgi:hypothetical protein
MPDELTSYLEAYQEAQRHMLDIKTLSSALSNVAKVLASPGAVYQSVPSSWPSAEQITDLLSNGRASLEKAMMLYSRVPNHLKARVPTPDSIGLCEPKANDNDDFCR